MPRKLSHLRCGLVALICCVASLGSVAQDAPPAIKRAASSAAPAASAAASSATAVGSPTPASVAPTAPANGGVLHFAQITDAHLFDAGYRCSGTFVEREYQENLQALQWSIAEVNARVKAGSPINFLVFTGDLGIANLAVDGVAAEHPDPVKDSSCKDNTPGAANGPITQPTFDLAEAQIAHILDDLPTGVTIYFVPGNNDLDDENLDSMPSRYTKFIDGLKAATRHTVVDLVRTPSVAGGYTLLGLNSAGFKPQRYTPPPSAGPTPCGTAECNESVFAGNLIPSGKYCTDLLANGTGPRAVQKGKAIDALVASMQGQKPPYLVFTHEPDLQEPNPDRRTNPGRGCEFRSTWLLTDPARAAWQASTLNNKDVAGIFAGHFHSADLTTYGGPKFNEAVATISSNGTKYVAPTFVTMPLAIKIQWPSYPAAARGMSFFTVNNEIVSPELVLYRPAEITRSSTTLLHQHPELAFWVSGLLTFALIVALLFLASTLDPKCVFSTTPVGRFRWIGRWFYEHLDCCWNQFTKLIIEGDTQSYSLSKLQFLLWTIATVYGYTYLYIAHTWVQGLPGLPDVTGKFPWETVLAGGTAVASQVSKQAFGTKGGGPLKPQLSDLISAGGVIASGRIQFLSWTLVAIAAYLSSIFASDPSTIHLLPEIPARLLEISGISAGTYLAARSVSPAGPLLTSAIFTSAKDVVKPLSPPDASTPGKFYGTLCILGDQLSKNSMLQAFQATHVAAAAAELMKLRSAVAGGTDSPIGLDQAGLGKIEELTGLASDAVSGVNGVPIEGFKYDPASFAVSDKDAVPGSPGLYTRLTVTLLGGPLPENWTLRVQNPDGKYAEVQVAMDSPPPTPPNAEPANPDPKLVL
jgi:hypothetical protein